MRFCLLKDENLRLEDNRVKFFQVAKPELDCEHPNVRGERFCGLMFEEQCADV